MGATYLNMFHLSHGTIGGMLTCDHVLSVGFIISRCTPLMSICPIGWLLLINSESVISALPLFVSILSKTGLTFSMSRKSLISMSTSSVSLPELASLSRFSMSLASSFSCFSRSLTAFSCCLIAALLRRLAKIRVSVFSVSESLSSVCI